MLRRIPVGGAAAALLGIGALVGPGYVAPSMAHAVTSCAPGPHLDKKSGKCVKDAPKPKPKPKSTAPKPAPKTTAPAPKTTTPKPAPKSTAPKASRPPSARTAPRS